MSNKIKSNKTAGFSLVELIVVIAIMAVLVAVLAPALLQYVEKSRAQRDDSAMGEVTNAIQLALADQDAYDEALECVISPSEGYSPSCYVDKDDPDETNNKIYTKNDTEWMFTDAERKADEHPYVLTGKMRGLSITFFPSPVSPNASKTQYVLADGVINYGSEISEKNGSLSTITTNTGDHVLYNRLRSTVGDTVPASSQTYRWSPYTVFIRMGTTGGAQSDKNDAIKVYGQWGGTNLTKDDAVVVNNNQGSGDSGNQGGNGGSGGQ